MYATTCMPLRVRQSFLVHRYNLFYKIALNFCMVTVFINISSSYVVISTIKRFASVLEVIVAFLNENSV